MARLRLRTASQIVLIQINRHNRSLWGRLVESCVGAYLCNQVVGTSIDIFYWREGHAEVDLVLTWGKKIIAIEVKSGNRKSAQPGMDNFIKLYRSNQVILIGEPGLSLIDFLKEPVENLF